MQGQSERLRCAPWESKGRSGPTVGVEGTGSHDVRVEGRLIRFKESVSGKAGAPGESAGRGLAVRGGWHALGVSGDGLCPRSDGQRWPVGDRNEDSRVTAGRRLVGKPSDPSGESAGAARSERWLVDPQTPGGGPTQGAPTCALSGKRGCCVASARSPPSLVPGAGSLLVLRSPAGG